MKRRRLALIGSGCVAIIAPLAAAQDEVVVRDVEPAPGVATLANAPAQPTSDYSFSLAPQSSDETLYGGMDDAGTQGGEPILWDGFLSGMNEFRDFPRPVGRPVTFEDPFINTDLRLLYVWHDIPNGSELRGGEIQAFAAQIRVALTERLQLTATKDGYSKVHTGITPDADGWNDFAIGIKYAFYVDPEEELIVSGGFLWEWDNGTAFALQGNEHEISPYVSFAKGFDKWHLIGSLRWRIPTDRNQGVHSLMWNLHVDYELFPDFFPLVEVAGMHWLTNGNRLPLSVEYLDVGNLGSNSVAGRDYFSAGVGFRWRVRENVSLGGIWEFALESADDNVERSRATVNVIISM